MNASPDFLYSCVLDGEGASRPTDRAEIEGWQSENQGTLWVHLDVDDQASRTWLYDHGGLDESVVEALLAGETRPRSFSSSKGLLVVLRGVNTNPSEDPEDMVSIRLWLEPNRIIGTRRRRLLSVMDIRSSLEQGAGPTTSGEFLAVLIERMADRIGSFVDSIEDRLSQAEESMADDDPAVTRQSLGGLRRKMAAVRRFLAPQRDALDRLYRQPGTWLSESEILHLREEADRITRYLEDLDLARERAVVLQEEFLSQLAQEQNTRMYVLSVVAAIFLPLSFLTGLLGMNVGGMPGVDSAYGFWISIALMVGAALLLMVFFRLKRWI